jgi:hypothetical protein
LERYLRVNLLGPGPRLIKNNVPGRGLTKVEKHWLTVQKNTQKYFKQFQLLTVIM